MHNFPALLATHLAATNPRFVPHCQPDEVHARRVRYSGAERPFRLLVIKQPEEVLLLHHLFVRYDLQRTGIGTCVIRTLQEFCRHERLLGITTGTLLPPLETLLQQLDFTIDDWRGYWKIDERPRTPS